MKDIKKNLKINLTNSLMRIFLFNPGIFILFLKNFLENFCVFVKDDDITNFIFKSKYQLLFIFQFLDRLKTKKLFFQLKFISVRYEIEISIQNLKKTAL